MKQEDTHSTKIDIFIKPEKTIEYIDIDIKIKPTFPRIRMIVRKNIIRIRDFIRIERLKKILNIING